MVDKSAKRQKEILEDNSRYVKPGGRLAYITCSLLRKENEDVVNTFLTAHPHFELIGPGKGGYPPDLEGDDTFVRLAPHRLNADGFFVAVMKRASIDFASRSRIS